MRSAPMGFPCSAAIIIASSQLSASMHAALRSVNFTQNGVMSSLSLFPRPLTASARQKRFPQFIRSRTDNSWLWFFVLKQEDSRRSELVHCSDRKQSRKVVVKFHVVLSFLK